MIGGILLGALAQAPPALADEVIAVEGRPTPLRADGGILVWSRYDSRSERYRLVVREGESTTVLPVRSRAVPFDADVGPDAGGRRVLVYSRCRRERLESGLQQGLNPRRDVSRGCDLYLFDLAANRERRIRSASRRDASEFLPTIWGDRLAFVRIYERRRGLRGSLPHIYVMDLETRREIRIRGSGRGVYGEIDEGTFDGGPGPGSLDLRGRTLAFGWESRREECGGARDPSGELLVRAEIWTVSVSGTRRRITIDCGERSVFAPSFASGGVYYLADQGRTVSRSATRGEHRAQARLAFPVDAMAQDGATTFYGTLRSDTAADPPEFHIVRAEPPLAFVRPGARR